MSNPGFYYHLQDGDSTSTIRELDDMSDFDFDLPSNDYKLTDNLGEGSQISGIGSLKGRKISASYTFIGNDVFEREKFLEWFTRAPQSTTYLYKNANKRIKCSLTNGSTIVIPASTSIIEDLDSVLDLKDLTILNNTPGITNGTKYVGYTSTTLLIDNAATASISGTETEFVLFSGRLKVFLGPGGGEGWKTWRKSDKVKIDMYSPSPYYTSTEVLSRAITLTGSSEHSTSVDIYSFRTPCQYQLSSTESFSVFQVKIFDGYGFKAAYSFSNSTNILVDTRKSNLSLTIDSTTIFSNVFSETSTPFSLEQGVNEIFVTAASGTLFVKWNERRL